MISIKNFVNTSIEVESQPQVFTGFRSTVYFAACTINTPDVEGGNYATLNSLNEFENKISATNSAIRESVKSYFQNGGVKLIVVAPSVFSLEGFKSDMYALSLTVDDYYFIVLSTSVVLQSSGYQADAIFQIANFCSDNGWSDADKKALHTMRACFTASTTSFITANSLASTLAIVKYSTYSVSGTVVDAALLVGAYYSQIDVSSGDKILDYNFTEEVLGDNYFEDINQATFVQLHDTPTNGYYNFIGKVANRVLNIGGDFVSPDGISISLDFGASCIERDLDYANMELLLGKLPLTSEGQSRLIAGIRQQLIKYVDNGFLESDAVYSGDTKRVTYNGTTYTVIEKGDAMQLGYKIFYVPINAISAADRSAKRFPYIYVALQSVHGARLIEVNGSIT